MKMEQILYQQHEGDEWLYGWYTDDENKNGNILNKDYQPLERNERGFQVCGVIALE